MKISGITIERFCDFHQVERQQILAFIEFGLIKVERQKKAVIIPDDEVEYLERFLRLANELGVNMEGLEIIHRMRTRIVKMQMELERLKQIAESNDGDNTFEDNFEFYFEKE